MERDFSKMPFEAVDIEAKLDRIVKEYPNGYAFGRYIVWDKTVLDYIGEKKSRAFIMIKGSSLPRVQGVVYRFHGKWSVDKKGKVWFAADYSEMKDSATRNSALRILTSDSFPSVNRQMAERLVSHFEDQIWTVIGGENWQQLTAVQGIDQDTAEQIHLSYIQTKSVTVLARYLSQYGISGNIVEKINDVYHENAVPMIQEDPYRMIKEVRGVGFETCDRIARAMFERGEKPDVLSSPRRVEAGIYTALRQECALTGGMYCEGNRLYQISMERLNQGINSDQQMVKSDLWKQVFDQMIEDHTLVDRRFKTPVDKGGVSKTVHFIFPYEFDYAERTIAYRFLKMAKQFSGIESATGAKAVKEYSDGLKYPLSKNQQLACVRSLQSKVSIITGGPGTGKTTILKCLISTYQKLIGGQVTCMAPTGKAARRMSESTGLPASTIHSRLGLVAVEGLKVETNQIQSGLVVVDEVSMVDTVLMSKLAENLAEGCHLVLVGDVDQLPSVGEGAVLSELISSGCIPTSRLTETFRQGDGSVIITNSAKVNSGRYDLEYNDDFRFVEASGELDAVQKITSVYKHAVDTYGIDNVALLCPLRNNREGQHPCSSDGMNPVLQNIFNPVTPETKLLKSGTKEFRLNDRVMKWSNGEKSSNGDIGVVKRFLVDRGVPAMEVDWDNGNLEIIRKQDFDSLTLSYSMSVHKSQGSEYACVIMPVISEQKCPLFNRAILYTALTRSKAKIILVGDHGAIKTMCTTQSCTKRNSLLATRLVYNRKKLEEYNGR